MTRASGAQSIFGKTGLKKGFHSIWLDYFQMGRAKKIVVKRGNENEESNETSEKYLLH